MNKRDTVLSLVHGSAPPATAPASFFLPFDPAYHQGQAAIDKHLEFFRATDMDFVKVQYEQHLAPAEPISAPEQWASAPRYREADFEPTIRVVEGLAKAARRDALVLLTVYSPFMWALRYSDAETLAAHLREHPAAVQQGLEIVTENVLTLLRACMRAGADGFYISTQGGEAFRFPGTDIFERLIKPTDLAVWDAVQACEFNILHVCDYVAPYADLSPFADYPGHVVNCSLALTDRTLEPAEVARLFERPFMGGMERLGALATGPADAIRQHAREALAQLPARSILAADCTVPAATPWQHLRAAIDVAHTR